MDETDRIVAEGLQYQGEDEEIAYTLDTSNWGGSPSAITVTAYDVTDEYEDVTATVLSGSASTAGDVITLPVVKSLTRGHLYQVHVKFTTGGQVMEAVVPIQGQR